MTRRDMQDAERLDALARAGNSHAFYAGIKQLVGERVVAAAVPELRRADGGVARGRQEVAAAFALHFEEVHRCGHPVAEDTRGTAAAHGQPAAAAAET